ncbi:MAG: hypothetical protein IJ776_05630 [Paludibacteraceae bacterium]|nr:hypothetical protein [Paludibacteraceae bacterium]
MEKYVKKLNLSHEEIDLFVKNEYPDVLYFVDSKQGIGNVVYICKKKDGKEFDIPSNYFSKYYERENVQKQKDSKQTEFENEQKELDIKLSVVLKAIDEKNPNWRNIKECIQSIKDDYPFFEKYIDDKYLQKQKELQKFEP